jgi:hypothetical protein
MIFRVIGNGMIYFSLLAGKVICWGWASEEEAGQWRKLKVPRALMDKLKSMETDKLGFHVEPV